MNAIKAPLISATVVALLAAIASIPGCSAMWILLLPGAFLAAVVFPQGVNSTGGNAYIVVSALLDVVVYALPIVLILELKKLKQ